MFYNSDSRPNFVELIMNILLINKKSTMNVLPCGHSFPHRPYLLTPTHYPLVLYVWLFPDQLWTIANNIVSFTNFSSFYISKVKEMLITRFSSDKNFIGVIFWIEMSWYLIVSLSVTCKESKISCFVQLQYYNSFGQKQYQYTRFSVIKSKVYIKKIKRLY